MLCECWHTMGMEHFQLTEMRIQNGFDFIHSMTYEGPVSTHMVVTTSILCPK